MYFRHRLGAAIGPEFNQARLTRIRRSRHEAHATDALCRGFEDFSFAGFSATFCSWFGCDFASWASFCWSFVLGMFDGDSVLIMSPDYPQKNCVLVIEQAKKTRGQTESQQRAANIRTKSQGSHQSPSRARSSSDFRRTTATSRWGKSGRGRMLVVGPRNSMVLGTLAKA
jgi:hypothetical protein